MLSTLMIDHMVTNMTPARAVLFLFSSFVIYALGLGFYRLYFHPLAGFPGPKLAAATQWYEFYFDVARWPGGQYMYEVSRMHDKYGPIVRITPHEIHVRDSEWYDTLYIPYGKGTRDKFRPSAHMTGTPLGTFGTVDHALHRKRRGAITPFFSKRAIQDFQPTLQKNVDKLCEAMLDQTKTMGKAEMRANFLALTTDSITDHAFGGENRSITLDLLGNVKNMRRWQKTIAALALLTPVAKQFPWLIPFALNIPVPLWMSIAPTLGRIVAVSREMHKGAQKAIDEESEEKDDAQLESKRSHNLFHSLLQSKLPSEERRRRRIAQEGVVVIAAGGETCARMMAFTVYFVLINREHVLPRLLEELKTVMPNLDSHADLLELEKLPWFTAIIRETLRITALVVTRLPLVSPDQALQYEDFVIPPGNPISMTLIDILHDPSIFPRPQEFRPERWLPESGEEYELANRFYLPFGRGTRACLGINMAYAMLYTVLSTLFRRFDVQLTDVDYDRDVKFSRDCLIGEPRRDTHGINVKIARAIA